MAATVVRTGRNGPWQGYAVYGATVLWALVGIVVAQYDASLLTTGTATVSAVPVALAVLSNLRGSRTPRTGVGRAVRAV